MDPNASIEQVKAQNNIFGDNMNRKGKVQAVRNSRITLGYMKDPEHGYSWINYITRYYLQEMPGYYLIHLI